MKKFKFPILVFTILHMLSLLSQAQHMFFHLLPGFGTPFTWIGLGADTNWNTGVVPTALDVATDRAGLSLKLKSARRVAYSRWAPLLVLRPFVLSTISVSFSA